MRYGYESKLSHSIPGTLSHSWLKKGGSKTHRQIFMIIPMVS